MHANPELMLMHSDPERILQLKMVHKPPTCCNASDMRKVEAIWTRSRDTILNSEKFENINFYS